MGWPAHFDYADRAGIDNSRGKKVVRGKGKVHKVMSEFKQGELHSGSKTGPKVTSREQAIAIAMSEAGMSRKKKKKGK